MTSSYIEKKPVKIFDLASEQAVSQRNYGRLLRLFSAWQQRDQLQFSVDGNIITIQVLQRERYSSVFEIQQATNNTPMVTALHCKLRVYHDAQMVDITEWNGRRRFRSRYDYPNHNMYSRDEKWQLNRFLGEWLDTCLSYGLATQALPNFSNSSQGSNL